MSECQYCHRKGFIAERSLRKHENACKVLNDFSLDCFYCGKPCKTVGSRRIHEGFCLNKSLSPKDPPKVSLHLTEDDVFAKQSAPSSKLDALSSTQNQRRYLRKRSERFERKTKRIKAAKKARMAMRHGWKPSNTFHGIKTDQL